MASKINGKRRMAKRLFCYFTSGDGDDEGYYTICADRGDALDSVGGPVFVGEYVLVEVARTEYGPPKVTPV